MKIKLKDLGEIITGNTPSKRVIEFWDSSDICFVKPDIINDTGITDISDTNEYISESARAKARIVGENAIFVTCIGSIGKIGIAKAGEYAFNQQINAIIPNSKVNPQYLAYSILYAKPQLNAIANAPVVPIINKSQFGDFEIEISENIEEQIRIVEVLDKTKAIIKARQQELQKLDELVKARFVEMFGIPFVNDKKLEIKKIGDVVTEVKYGTSRPAVDGGKYPYLRMNNLTNDGNLDLTNLKYIDIPENEIEKCIVRKGDVLFNRTNSLELVGKTALFDLDEDMVIAGYIIRVRLKACLLPEVFAQYMNLEPVKELLHSMAKGAVNQANINAQELQNIDVYIPEIDMQREFVSFKRQLDKSKVAVQKALDEAQLLFDSLMQKYFG